MTDRPVLDTLRALLKFKDSTTISEVASTAGIPRRRVLDVINQNHDLVTRNRKTGRITKVDPQGVLKQRERESGRYYFRDSYGAWSHEGWGLKFTGHDDLRERLQRGHVTGGIGDSFTQQVIDDTPENRAAIEAEGLVDWATVEIDDRLWEEDPR